MDLKFESGLSQMAIDDHIRMAIEAEGEKARKEHGAFFSSHHEAWAVLMEEMEEMCDETERLIIGVDELWLKVKLNGDPELTLVRMKSVANRLIQESIQVAAMIDKYSRTNDLFNRAAEAEK